MVAEYLQKALRAVPDWHVIHNERFISTFLLEHFTGTSNPGAFLVDSKELMDFLDVEDALFLLELFLDLLDSKAGWMVAQTELVVHEVNLHHFLVEVRLLHECRHFRRYLQWNLHLEFCALSQCALDFNSPVHYLNELLANAESKTCAPVVLLNSLISLIVGFEKLRETFLRYANACIRHFNL